MSIIYHLHDSTLLATFYGQRGKLTTLKDHLIQTRQLIAEDTMTFVNSITDTLLLCFDPPATRDTSVIQLALNDQRAPHIAWHVLRTQLEVALNDALLQWPIWGYSLVYQALLIDNPAPTVPCDMALRPTLESLVPSVQRLQPSPGESLPILARSPMPGGQLSLHSIPRENDGLQAAIIYVALSYPHTDNQLVRQTLVGPGATLLMPDVIAHKSYHQIRQYHSGGWLDNYNHLVQTAREHTQHALQASANTIEQSTLMTTLDGAYRNLMGRVLDLDALQTSLAQQQENYPPWLEQLPGDTAVLVVHQQHLQMALRELALLQEKGTTALNGAHMVLSAVQPPPAPVTLDQAHSTIVPVAAAEPIQLIVHFTRTGQRVHLTWTSDVLGRTTSTFTPPYRGSDLELVIRALDAVQHPDHPLAGPTFTPGEQTRLHELGLWGVKRVSPHASKTVGQALYTALTRSSNGRAALQRVREIARYEQRPIQYVFRFPAQAVELAALPWEAMRDQHQAILFSRGAREVDSCERYLDLAMALPPPSPPRNTLRILALAPVAEIDPAVRQEERAARVQIWEALQSHGLVEWDELSPVTITHLDDWRRRNPPPDIVHFYGHGIYQQGQGHLLFDAPDTSGGDRFTKVSAQRLAAILGDIRLIMLCACQSSMVATTARTGGLLTGVAPALSVVSEGVVAMQLTTRVRAATRFASVFYEEVARGRSVQAAVAEARRSLYVTETDGVSWYVPTLYIRSRRQEPWYVMDRSAAPCPS